jgi:hypothetical protein
MSDEVEAKPEEFLLPHDGGSRIITVRVGSFNYLFERTLHGSLIYVSRSPVPDLVDDDVDKPFDPSQYR